MPGKAPRRMPSPWGVGIAMTPMNNPATNTNNPTDTCASARISFLSNFIGSTSFDVYYEMDQRWMMIATKIVPFKIIINDKYFHPSCLGLIAKICKLGYSVKQMPQLSDADA
jgi:hypothetical protein